MYTKLAEIPLPTNAQFTTPSGENFPKGLSYLRFTNPLLDGAKSATVLVSYSLRDHARNVKRSISKSLVFSLPDPHSSDAQSQASVVATHFTEESEIVLQAISPSKRKIAVLRKTKGDGSKASRFVEIWSGSLLEILCDVTDLHGEFYNDGMPRLHGLKH